MGRWVLLSLVASPLALAAEGPRTVRGVEVPAAVQVEGKALALNGAGVRQKLVFDVYVAALYAQTPSKSASELIHSEQVKVVELRLLRDVTAAQVFGGIREAIERNQRKSLPALRDRLDRFCAAIPGMKEGERLRLTYLPGVGVRVERGQKLLVEVAGRDFGEAVFSAWLGEEPADEGLKRALLGG